jgi:hypothetical protein
MSRVKLRALEEAERAARAQLEETMADTCGNLEGPLPPLREIAAEHRRDGQWSDASEVLGHGYDLMQDVKTWRKAVWALLDAREEINAARRKRRVGRGRRA